MEMKKELEEKLDEEDAIELTPEEEEKNAEEDARARFTFDPLNKVFDDRKRRVTYLQECSRVTLAKPLPTEHETLIEMRRGMHTRIYNQYRKEKCRNGVVQQSDLTDGQQEGLKTLKKRISEGEIVVLKTDKSGKLCVATRDAYREMVHAGNDKVIGRKETQEKLMDTLWPG